MADLAAVSVFETLLPIERGGLRLTDVAPRRITRISPRRGREAAVETALKKAFSVSLPGPGQAFASGAVRLWWHDEGGVLLIGPDAPPLAAADAIAVDVSDAWGLIRLAGPAGNREDGGNGRGNGSEYRDGARAVQAVLSRLAPLDLRPHAFAPGHTARSLLHNIPAQFTRCADGAFEILVPRSMAGSAVAALSDAIGRWLARMEMGSTSF